VIYSKKAYRGKNPLFVACYVLWCEEKSIAHLFEGAGLLYVNLNVGIVDDFSLLAFFFFGCFFHFCSPF
jgi:hypothetical protein